MKKQIISIAMMSLTMCSIAKSSNDDLPYYSESIKFFSSNKEKFNELFLFLDKNSNISKATLLFDTGLMKATDSNRQLIIFDNSLLKKYGKLMQEIKTIPILKTDIGRLFFIGSENEFGKNFQVSFVFPLKNKTDLVPCTDVVKQQGVGACFYPLEESWLLYYEWFEMNLENTDKKIDIKMKDIIKIR